MTISLINGSENLAHIATAFHNRHHHILSAFNITIAIASWRGESVESFSIKAEINDEKVNVEIGLTLDRSL